MNLTHQLIGAVAFVLNVWGNLELTKVGNRGHIIRLCSNACWLVYSPLVGAWALFLNHSTFAAINVLGFVRWRRAEREGRIGSTPAAEVAAFRELESAARQSGAASSILRDVDAALAKLDAVRGGK